VPDSANSFARWQPCRGFALFARCAAVPLGHDGAIDTAPETLMKSHWPDWLMAFTLAMALGAAAMGEVVESPLLAGLFL
jgi:hypothetical protein